MLPGTTPSPDPTAGDATSDVPARRRPTARAVPRRDPRARRVLVHALRAAAEIATHPVTLLTLVHVSVLALRLPAYERLPGWFIMRHDKPLGPPALLLGLAVLTGSAWLCTAYLRQRPWLAVSLCVAIGFVLQHGWGWSEQRGLNGIRDRVVSSGHAELMQVATEQPSLWQVLSHYESKVQSGELREYARSKPPGTLLFYMVTERAGELAVLDTSPDARIRAARDIAAIFWPLLACCTLFPLFFTLRSLMPDETALLACVLHLVVPSATLISLHTDQCLFPLLFMSTLACTVAAQQRRSRAWSFAAGAALYLASFFTFAMLLAAPIAAACAVALEAQRHDAGDRFAQGRALLKTALFAAAGFAALWTLFALAFQYDFLVRYHDALHFHAQWKRWQGGSSEVVYFAWLNSLEYAVWLGLPISWFGLQGGRGALLRVLDGRSSKLALPALSLALAFTYLLFFGQTKAETSRLWLFLTPLCCAFAAHELHQPRYRTWRCTAIVWLLTLQWVTLFLIKAHHDFL